MSGTFHWRHVAALIASAALGAAAQPAPPSSRPASTAAGTAASTQPSTTPYRSAFENYRPFAEEKLAPWKESNDMVGAIGGWRAYAKEASEQTGKPQSSPGISADPHAGHAKP